MQHFFIDRSFFQNSRVQFPPEISRQIEHVLRLDLNNDQVILLDDSGAKFLVRLDGKTNKILFGTVIESFPGIGEAKFELTLCFSLTKREKIEWILQKGTEIGVALFQPFVSHRSIDRNIFLEEAKFSRWKTIIREAAEQSRRARLPRLGKPFTFESLFANDREGATFIAWEGSDHQERLSPEFVMKKCGNFPKKLILLIGPEGGFSDEEIKLALSKDCFPFSLGPRILRMETACLVASALFMHLYETLADDVQET